MKRLIKIELYRAFHGRGMKASLLIGALLALEHFIFRALPVTKYMFTGYHPDFAQSIIKNAQSRWMEGTNNASANLYMTIVFLLITIPYAASYYTDHKSGVLKNIAVRANRKNYLYAKCIAVFLSAGTAAVFPLLLDLMLVCTMFPVINYGWLPVREGALFVRTYLSNPILYDLMSMCRVFIFAGLIAGLSLTISLYANNIFVVLSLPFLAGITISRLVVYSGNEFIFGLSPAMALDISSGGPLNLAGMLTLAVLLLAIGYVTFFIKGVRKDVL